MKHFLHLDPRKNIGIHNTFYKIFKKFSPMLIYTFHNNEYTLDNNSIIMYSVELSFPIHSCLQYLVTMIFMSILYYKSVYAL